jgi:hypothetical protein
MPPFSYLLPFAVAGLPLRIRGDCMAPELVDGATVVVKRRRLYLPGDIVVFRTPAGDLAAHRVLGWRPAGLVTKGDGCVAHDAPVPADALLGAVVSAVPLRSRVRALVDFVRLVGRRIMR